MNIKSEITKRIEAEIQQKRELLTKVQTLEAGELPDDFPAPEIFGDVVDFNRLNRDQILQVIAAIPGKWDKTPSTIEGKLNYITYFNGLQIRIWAGDPPASCTLIEELVEVPARIEKRYKLQCS